MSRLAARDHSGAGRASGFTLIELLVVVAIIGILAAIALSKLQGAIIRARVGQSIANAHTIQSAIHMYLALNPNGTPPVFTTGLAGSPPCTSFELYIGAGGTQMCPELNQFLTILPDNTVNNPSVNGNNFLWNSAAGLCTDQYPSTNEGGFFYSRRYNQVMLNSNAIFLDSGKKFYELGQSWSSNGVDACQPGFGGPMW